jgi:NADH-quinone oxidoreductase subunit C
MRFTEIKELLIRKFGSEAFADTETVYPQPQLIVKTSEIAHVCEELRDHELTYFDFLSCITAIDNGPAKGTMEVIYHLFSIPYEHHMVLKVVFARGHNDVLPVVPSLSEVYKTAIWHEREAYDFFGIVFEGHPDLRRIFLPLDWDGYPLRKDYHQQDYYRGIKVEY